MLSADAEKLFFNFKKDCTKLLSPVFQDCMLSHIFRNNFNLKIDVNFLDDTKLVVWPLKTKVSREHPSNPLGELNSF